MPLITLLGDKRVPQHVVDENIIKVVWFCVRASIAVQLEIKCIFAICGLLLLYGSSICVPWECHKTCLIYCSPSL